VLCRSRLHLPMLDVATMSVTTTHYSPSQILYKEAPHYVQHHLLPSEMQNDTSQPMPPTRPRPHVRVTTASSPGALPSAPVTPSSAYQHGYQWPQSRGPMTSPSMAGLGQVPQETSRVQTSSATSTPRMGTNYYEAQTLDSRR
jgi:hypothetical protein